VFVTALYTFRMLFLTFHGPERFRAAPDAHATHDEDHGHGGTPRESPAVVTLPLIALAIPSVVIGALTVDPVLFGGYFGHSIFVLTGNDVVGTLAADFGGPVQFALHGLAAPPFWFALAGAATAWACFLWRPQWADAAVRIRAFGWLYRTLTHKYYFDWFNEQVLAALTRLIGVGLWKGGDEALIDGAMVNGSAATVGWVGGLLRRVQSGYLYSYAFWMMIGLAVLLGWFLAHTRY
jgi:NADH-quinone oxidoreductase subunit L